MRFVLKRVKDRLLYSQEKGAEKYPAGVVDAFFEVMSMIAGEPDERGFYARKSLNFKKLKGDRQGRRSLRLNDQYRLIVSVEQDTEGKYLLIHKIDKH